MFRFEFLRRLTFPDMIAFDNHYRDFDSDPDTGRMIRVAAGDREAFNELVQRNFASTVRIIGSMLGNYSRAEDLAQDVFLRVYRSRQRYLPTAKFSTFLGTIIRNTVLNEKRRLSRQRDSTAQFVDGGANQDAESGMVPAPAYEVDFVEHLDREHIRSVVSAALADLPLRQRRAIELVHFHGMTYVKAAQEMETSRKAVKSLLGRGRQQLSEILGPQHASS